MRGFRLETHQVSKTSNIRPFRRHPTFCGPLPIRMERAVNATPKPDAEANAGRALQPWLLRKRFLS